MIKRLKKGFTLVELVVVIAVIAILAAVSVVSYIGITKKAQESNDKMVIDQINSSLETSQIFDKKLTLHEIVERFEEEEGYDVRAIKPELADTEFVFSYEKGKLGYWKAKENKVVYPSDLDGMTKNNDLWFFSDGQAKFDDGASHYIKDAKGFETIETEGGIDLGKTTGVKKVVYDRKDATDAGQSVVIRTNSKDMELEVNAPKDTLKHFGDVGTLNIIAIKNKSCHEYGSAEFVEIKSGRYALEKGSEVNHIHFVAKTSSTFDDITISKDQNVEMPAFSRDNVEIATQGTLVVALQSGTEEITESTDLDYVWLTKQGIYEQIVVSDNGETKENAGSSEVEWVNTSSKSAETKEAAQQIANNIGRDETGKASGTVIVNDTEYVVTVDPTTRELVVKDTDGKVAPAAVVEEAKSDAVEEKANKEEAKKGATLFAGGSGTQLDPFLISDYETFQHVSSLYSEGYYYFKVKDGVSSINCANWVPVNMNGSIEGNNVKIVNLDKSLFEDVDGQKVSISNFDISANISVSGGVAAVVGDDCNTCNLLIDNVDVHGTIIGANWVVSYVTFGPGPSNAWNCVIKNSVSDATLVATSGSASGFIGHPYDDVSNGSVNGLSLITIEDSAYIGNMSATGDPTKTNYYGFKYFTINGNDNRIKTLYSDEFIDELGFEPEGTLYNIVSENATYPVIYGEDGSTTFFGGNYGKNLVDHYKVLDKKAKLDTQLKASLPENIGSVFSVTKVTGATKATFSLLIAPNDANNYGSYLGTYMEETIDISAISSGASFQSEAVRYFQIKVNSSETSKTGVSGNVFNVVNSYYGLNAHNGASVKIVQYDTNGNVLNITSLQIAGPHVAE